MKVLKDVTVHFCNPVVENVKEVFIPFTFMTIIVYKLYDFQLYV